MDADSFYDSHHREILFYGTTSPVEETIPMSYHRRVSLQHRDCRRLEGIGFSTLRAMEILRRAAVLYFLRSSLETSRTISRLRNPALASCSAQETCDGLESTSSTSLPRSHPAWGAAELTLASALCRYTPHASGERGC